MSSWMNDATVQKHNGNSFPYIDNSNTSTAGVGSMMDPAAFMATSQVAQFNTSHPYVNSQHLMQQQQQLQPGPPMYQTNQIIPSKRPRPREENIIASPRQNLGMLPKSRVEVPQQSHFSGHQQPGHPQSNPQAPLYPHLPHNGSANATPSPIMANQIRAGSVPQRVATTSPHPFSPATQSFAPQASPVPSDPSSLPPQQQAQNSFGQSGGAGFMPGYNPKYTHTPPPARPSPNQQQTSSIPQHMGQIAPQIGQLGQMNPQLAALSSGGMGPGGSMGQMSSAAQLAQVPNAALFTPQMQQQLAQARNPLEQQKLMYQIQLQRQLQQSSMQSTAGNQTPNQNIIPQQRSMIARQQQQQQHHQQQQQQLHQHQHQQHIAQQKQQPQSAQQSQLVQQIGLNGQMSPSTSKSAQSPSVASNQNGYQRTSDQFFSQLSVFMQRMNLPLDSNPVAGDRPIHLMQLFQFVQKHGGYRNITANNYWPQVSNALGFLPAQISSVAGLVKAIYERNLLKFEEFVVAQSRAKANQQQQNVLQQAQSQAHEQLQQQSLQQQQDILPPTPQQQQPLHDLGGLPSIPTTPKSAARPKSKRQASGTQPPELRHAAFNGQVNGFTSPHPPVHQQPALSASSKGRDRDFRSAHTTDEYASSSGAGISTSSTQPPAHPDAGDNHVDNFLPDQPLGQMSAGHRPGQMSGHFRGPVFDDSDEYKPLSRSMLTFGGVDVNAPAKVVTDILQMRPEVPAFNELGNIDIHAITKSIQSGIHSEVRLALDTLATVTATSLHGHEIELDKCDELLEALIEYADELLEILAENTVEVSDDILIPHYEDVARVCQIERLSIRDEPEIGSEDEEMDRTVSRLLCITTIMRNLSFNPRNQTGLADEVAVKFLCRLIRYMGTRNMLLRTQLNMLDFMKDAIIFLSNVASSIEIPDQEEALCFLQFLLAFAPASLPSLGDDHLFFPSYQPTLHPYLPAAVDALAKLLARDEPNRTHFRTLFGSDSGSAGGLAPHDLLTHAFALAISPIPEHLREVRPHHLPPVFEARKPAIMQGLLAANIVASLAPNFESGVTRAWLMASNGFVPNLHRTVRDLCRQYESVEIHLRQQHMQRLNGRNQHVPAKDAELMYIVVMAISMLRKLGEKAIDPSDKTSSLPPDVLPSQEYLLKALEMCSGEWSRDGFLHSYVAFAALDGK
ncbi:component of SWI/SNF global activator complex [Sporothrix epigloea]|uniref:Component of SWI/SNF global activator complex n=1 Tax=Sporothrix epigloea TaxID=1892477 RepID=A0ABP0DZZ4_9PEZI